MAELTNRQQEIMQCALDVIAESGVQALTIKSIAQKMGMTEAALYRHFESKFEILASIVDYFAALGMDNIRKAVAQQATATEKLEAIIVERFRIISENKALICMITDEEIFKHEKKLFDKMIAIHNESYAIIKNIIIEGQQNGEFRDDIQPRYFFNAIIGAFQFIGKKWKHHIEEFKWEDEVTNQWIAMKKMMKPVAKDTK